VPYVLLGLLRLGAGLGVGLGLAEGPVEHSAAASPSGVLVENPCAPYSARPNPAASCRPIRFSFSGGPTIPTDSVKCVLKGLAEVRPMSTAAYKRDETRLLSTCESRGSEPKGRAPATYASAVFGTGGSECSAAQLQLHAGPEIVPLTSQDPQSFVLLNVGQGPCTLEGYPALQFYSATGSLMPFRYEDSGDQEVTPNPPESVELAPNHAAFFSVDIFTAPCSVFTPSAATIAVALSSSTRLASTVAQYPNLGYCPSAAMDISPFEPSLGSALSTST
jgi:hypothetical protein